MPDIEIRMCGADELRIETRGLARVIRGYAIVFQRLSENLGFFREQIAPEAVDRTLKEGVDLRALVNHDGLPLGRMSAGTLRVEKDIHGLLVEIDPPAWAEHVTESIKRRDVTGMSFAFRTLKDAWDESTDPPTRTVTDMLMREVSVVTLPAYPQTDVAMRSLSAQRASLGHGRPVLVSDRLAWSKSLTRPDPRR
jgi:Escherichia/Staphylococcus phage prohead protease